MKAIDETNQTQEKEKSFGEKIRAGAQKLFAGTKEADGALWALLQDDFAVPEQRWKKNALFAAGCAGVFALTALPVFARFSASAYPGVFALVSAAGGGVRNLLKRRAPSRAALLGTAAESIFFLAALFFAAFLPHGFFAFLFAMALYLVRAGVTGGKMDDSPLQRVTACGISSGIFALLSAALGGFSAQAVTDAVALALLAPALTYLLSGFSSWALFAARKENRFALYSAAGTYLFLSLYALRDLSFFGVSPAAVIAGMATLAAARKKGALFGAGVGIVTGLAAGNAVFFAAAGFASGLFFADGDFLALTVSAAASGGYALLFCGVEAFADLFGAYAVAVFASLPLFRAMGKEKAPAPLAARESRRRLSHARRDFKEMSDAFSSLSEVFYTVTDTLKAPSAAEVGQLVANACSEICSGCALSGVCWGKNARLSNEASAHLAARLLQSGTVTDIPEEPFHSRCVKRREFFELLEKRFRRLNGTEIKNNKTRLLASEYSAVSRLIRSGEAGVEKETAPAPQLESRAREALKKLGISYRRAAVFGQREITLEVSGVQPERIRRSGSEVAKAFGEAFSCEMAPPAFLYAENECVMRLQRKKTIRLECARAGCTKKGEAVSGDTGAVFETGRGYFYALICDGMGSGREAAYTSRVAAIFLEKLLSCASPKNVTLEMLNAFLLAKTDEVFTTVDLLEVDLYSASALFIKAGGAPSYLFRDGRIHRVASRTPPAGILPRPVAQQTAASVLPGDLVLMLSDGALPGEEAESLLLSALAGKKFESAKALCDAVFEFASSHFPLTDDRTVFAVRAEKA